MISADAYTLVTNDSEFSDALSILKMSKAIGVDTETSGLDPYKNNVRLIQLSDGVNTFLIDVWKFDDDYIGSVLSDLLATSTITKVLHNAVFDLKFFQIQFRTTIRRIFDTMLAAQMLGSHSASLESVVYDYLGEHLDKTQQRSDWTQYVLGHEQLRYAALDAHLLVPLYEEQKRQLVEQKMAKVAAVEFQTVPAVAEMERTGVKIDLERLDAFKAVCMVRRGEAVVDFESCMDEPAQMHLDGIDPPPRLNLRSPKQVQEAFSAFGIPLEGTAVDVLKKVDHPAAKALLEHRKYSKLIDTYLDPYPTLVHEKTGRIHASFHQCRTVTGRFSCVSGDTPIHTTRGTFRIDEYMPLEDDLVVTHKESLRQVLRKIYKGVDKVFRVCLTNGAELKCTADHKIYTPRGWQRVADIGIGDEVYSYVSFKNLYEEPRERREGIEPLPLRRETYPRTGLEDVGYELSQRHVHSEDISPTRQAESGASTSILSLEDGGPEPHERKEWISAPQLHRGYRGRSWVFDAKGRWEVCICPQDSYGRSLGTIEPPREVRSTPHRREYKEQRHQQLSSGNKDRTPIITQETSQVRQITPVGVMGTWDIEVAGDHSYATQGFLNHNCSAPNLQQCPATQEFRSLFVAEEGNMLITADFSQIELRILAELTQDPTMIEGFNKGYDFHSYTASQTFGVPIEEVTKEQRSAGKTLGFALIYGQGPQATAEQIGVSVDEAKEMIEAYFAEFTKVRTWMDRQRRQAKKDGFVRTLLGRKVPLGDDKNRQEREAINYPIQGSSADITKIALSSLYERFENYENVKLVNCVHDEIVVEAPEEEAQSISEAVRRVMETAGTNLINTVPVAVDVEVAHEWSKG